MLGHRQLWGGTTAEPLGSCRQVTGRRRRRCFVAVRVPARSWPMPTCSGDTHIGQRPPRPRRGRARESSANTATGTTGPGSFARGGAPRETRCPSHAHAPHALKPVSVLRQHTAQKPQRLASEPPLAIQKKSLGGGGRRGGSHSWGGTASAQTSWCALAWRAVVGLCLQRVHASAACGQMQAESKMAHVRELGLACMRNHDLVCAKDKLYEALTLSSAATGTGGWPRSP